MQKSKKLEIDEIEKSIGMRTAILVDGSFFLKRHNALNPASRDDPQKVANDFYKMVMGHVEGKSLYRILYYDCIPFSKKIINPISSTMIDFSTTSIAKFRLAFFNELRKKRKIALRLGELHDGCGWVIKPHQMKKLLAGTIKFTDLKESDIHYDLTQKGVDIKIGTDIAALTYKRLVQQIILISGDSDFVPAAKVARRDGIDFILDPMWNHIADDLFEHIDGLRSVCPKPKNWKDSR